MAARPSLGLSRYVRGVRRLSLLLLRCSVGCCWLVKRQLFVLWCLVLVCLQCLCCGCGCCTGVFVLESLNLCVGWPDVKTTSPPRLPPGNLASRPLPLLVACRTTTP